MRAERQASRAGGRGAAALAVAVAGLLPSAAPAQSILARVLDLIDSEPLTGLFVNMAENLPQVTTGRVLLQPGDEVVVGFDAQGMPVTAVAGAAGLRVDAGTAAGMSSGLAAGLYPIGSALYDLPPGGQLSLWQEAANGAALAEARALMTSRIDGRILIGAYAAVTEDLDFSRFAATAVTQSAQTAALGEELSSTVLGVSNAGVVLAGLDQLGPKTDFSDVSVGVNGLVQQARSGTASALVLTSGQIGGSAASPALVANIGANAADVTGAVLIEMQGVALRVGRIGPTVIGAVNGGRIVAGASE